jgi:outer membrane protein, heavy metal efflux system
MMRLSLTIFVALLLTGSILAQNHSQNGAGLASIAGATASGQAQEQQKMGSIEMQTPQNLASHVTAVQEPENPLQQTGSNLPVPDLLQSAQGLPRKHLADFETLALKNNPTLKQAQSIVRADSGLAQQAGLWPNPLVGYQGEQIRGGVFRGGEQGGFVQQNIVLGGKLRLRRDVYEQQRKVNEIAVDEQQLAVRGSVAMYFYSALAQLHRVTIQRELLNAAMDAATTAHQLANVGQADAPDVLQAEAEAEVAKVQFVRTEREYIEAYQQLAAVAGDPQIPLSLVDDDLEHPPLIDPDKYLQELIANSPTFKRAQQEFSRAQAVLARDEHEAVPDLSLRAGVQQNLELNDFSALPVGGQAFATASIQIPLFNRNQGNVQASRAELEQAQEEVERVRLQLLRMAQPLLQQYLTSKLEAERYSQQIIPRAQRAYELYLGKYRNMAAAYPEVLISQRTLFQFKDDYVRTLGEQWAVSIQLQNYLLSDGLKLPVSSGAMGTQGDLPTSVRGGVD